MTSIDLSIQLNSLWYFSFELKTDFASSSTVSYVNFKLENVGNAFLFLWIQLILIQSQNYL